VGVRIIIRMTITRECVAPGRAAVEPADPDQPCDVCGGARSEHYWTVHAWTVEDDAR